jgi:hypothetical protein
MGMSMRKIEIIAIAESQSKVVDVLKDANIRYLKVRDIEAVDRLAIMSLNKGCCGQGKKKEPSLIKKAQNYTKTMARWIKEGRPIVSLRVLSERLLICSGCDSLQDYVCIECGCPMDTKAKMDIDKLCELNKW